MDPHLFREDVVVKKTLYNKAKYLNTYSMLMIRLQRIGKKKSPSYRLVVSEKTKDTQAGSPEILGIYNPVQDPKITELKADRIKHWISKGAQPSETVNNLLIKEGVIEGKKMKSVAITNKRQDKMDKKKVEAESVSPADKEVSAEEPKAEAEAPVEAPAEVVKEGDEQPSTNNDQVVEEKVEKAEIKAETPVEEAVVEEPKEAALVEEKPKEEEKPAEEEKS